MSLVRNDEILFGGKLKRTRASDTTSASGALGRWRDYSSFNLPLREHRIIPVKTPLSANFHSRRPGDNLLPEEEWFTPSMLAAAICARFHARLVLVVDLTFTNRYYHPKELSSKGVHHVKIKCPGQQIPSDMIYAQFERELDAALSRQQDGFVAVHCTHGVNRTGYLICRYLVCRHGYSADKALEAFNEARGSPIEREQYIADLRRLEEEAHRRHGSCPHSYRAPPRPDFRPRGRVSPSYSDSRYRHPAHQAARHSEQERHHSPGSAFTLCRHYQEQSTFSPPGQYERHFEFEPIHSQQRQHPHRGNDSRWRQESELRRVHQSHRTPHGHSAPPSHQARYNPSSYHHHDDYRYGNETRRGHRR